MEKKRREPGPLILAIAVHVVVAILILNAAFHYDFSGTHDRPPNQPVAEHLTFMEVAPAKGNSASTDTTSAAKSNSRTAPRANVAPIATPTGIAAPLPSAGGQPTGVDGGRGNAVAATLGVVPAQPDARLNTDSHEFFPVPKSHAERVDSAVRAAIYAYNDSIARLAAAQGRKPGDWTMEKNGQKWGIDGNKIYLGKFAIPSAVLAALPIRIQGNPGEGLSDRLAPSRRADLLLHAESAYREDDFRDAVKRIRERKDKERREKDNGDVPLPIASP